jgi:hypothetical protein
MGDYFFTKPRLTSHSLVFGTSPTTFIVPGITMPCFALTLRERAMTVLSSGGNEEIKSTARFAVR